jgi:hypothetical protein
MLSEGGAESKKEGKTICFMPSVRERRAGMLCDRRSTSPMGGRYLFLGILVVAIVSSFGCQLVPRKPEAVFVLYRERMTAGKLEDARALLSEESRDLALKLAAKHKLRQPPESIALLNMLDPASPPLVVKEADDYALLQVRTIKGALRLIRLGRADAGSPWNIDISEELKGLRLFLEARGALDMIREQAGEYAAFYRAFSDQLERMSVTEPQKEIPSQEQIREAAKKSQKKVKTGKNERP